MIRLLSVPLAVLVLSLTGLAEAKSQQPNEKKVQPYLKPQDSAVVVTWVVPRGPAARAGIRSGDVILKVDDAHVNNLRDLSEALRDAQGDVQLTVTNRKGDGQRTVRVDPNRTGRIGIYAETYFFPGPSQQAVEVTYVYPGSPAARSGLERGDIILSVDGRRTDSFEDLRDALREAKGGARLEVVNVRNGRRVFIYVYPDENNQIGINADLTIVSVPDRWQY